MKKTLFIIALALVVVVILFIGRNRLSHTGSEDSIRVLLLGASVGKAWNFPEWPKRMKRKGYIFEMIPYYSFDKSEALDEILMRPKRRFRLTRTFLKSLLKPAPKKPDIMIIKECAAYFPGNLNKYKPLMKKWITQCRKAGIKPVLTTVIPVTKAHAQRKPGRLKGIIEYNDWAKEYARVEDISYLDLESILRISDTDRSLRSDLPTEDGLHLNKKAYKILDKLLLDRLEHIL